MSLLARARLCVGKRWFGLHTIAALQQLNFYSTKATDVSQKTVKLTQPRTQKAPGSFSQRVKKQTEALNVWPKPREIPYQAKVANFVNLIGYVRTPVKFEAAKHSAAIVISQQNSGGKSSMLIPVVFEGDLAHVVAYHVKENDCVFVSGQLSGEPMRFALSESLGRFHVLAENLNFVEGLRKSVSGKKIGVSFLDVEIDKAGTEKIEESMDRVDHDEIFNQQWKDALEHAKSKNALGLMRRTESSPEHGDEKSGESADKKKDGEDLRRDLVKNPGQWKDALEHAKSKNDSALGFSKASSAMQRLPADAEEATLERSESKPDQGNEESGESADYMKDGEGPWRDLVRNSLQWWDYRDHKSNGLVKEKYPDFKHKGTGEALWVNAAPKWVLSGLGKLEFDVKFIKPKPVQAVEGSSERRHDSIGEGPWKNLVEFPGRWWDNRLRKRNPKAPDFRHKETGEVLWLNRVPDWAYSRLPPLKDGQNTDDGKKNPQIL